MLFLNDNRYGEFIWDGRAKFTSDPSGIPSPTMAGGLLVMDRRLFWEIGGYDEQVSNFTNHGSGKLDHFTIRK